MAGFSYPTPARRDFRDDGGKNENDDHGAILVGSTYNGSKVIDVQVEISDRGTRVRKRSIIKLENGAIAKEDHWKDKVFEEVDTSRRRAPVRSKSNDANLPVMTAGNSTVQQGRGLGPKTKSGRQLPKPTAPSRMATKGTAPALPPIRSDGPARGSARRSSRGQDFIREPPRPSKSSDLENLRASSHSSSGLRPSGPDGGGNDAVDRDLSPEAAQKPSSLKNLSNFLISPIRQAPGFSKSGNDLDALRDSLHSSGGRDVLHLPPKRDGKPTRRTSAMGMAGDSKSDRAPETPQRNPRSINNLGVLISPRMKPPRSKSGELESMQGSLHMEDEGTKSEPFKMEKRSSLPTSESNREKLRSFKNMIAMPPLKTSTRSPSPAAVQREQEPKSRRSSMKHEQHQQVAEKSRRGSLQHHQQPPQSPAPRRGSVSSKEIKTREPSLSPEQVKKPGSSSYIASLLDSFYDSFVADGDEEGSDEDGGYDNSQGLLESSFNRFVEWAE
jgi:hypothetical protein